MHLYLIRHADPDYAADTLTEHGNREAQALADRFVRIRPNAVHASPIARAMITAEAISRSTGVPVKPESWLREPGHLRVTQSGREYCIWDTFGETVRGNETMPTHGSWSDHSPFDSREVRSMWSEFRGAVDGFIAGYGYERIGGRYRPVRPNCDQIVLVSHNGTVLLLLSHLLEIPLSLAFCGFFIWPSSVTTVYFEEQSTDWAVPRALSVADLSHLAVADLSPQPRGMGSGLIKSYLPPRHDSLW